jgi:hypothetical protein
MIAHTSNGGVEQKCQPPQKKNGRFCCEGTLKWTLDTGGLHESAHVIEGVRHLSKEEYSVVLQ